MTRNHKTKTELLSEIETLTKRVAALERRSLKQKKSYDALRAEFALIENAVRGWKKTIDSSKSMMMLIGNDYSVKRVNLATSEFLGMSFQQLLGRNCSELFLDADLSVEDCLLEKVKKRSSMRKLNFISPEKTYG